MTDLATRYRAIVEHYAKLAQNPATVDHARYQVREFREQGLTTLPEDVAKEINESKDRRQSA